MSISSHALPSEEWGLDPIFFARPKLFVSSIHGLNVMGNINNILCLNDHPIQGAHIVGNIVAISKKFHLKSFVKYLIDDGSGLMECVVYEKDLNGNEHASGAASMSFEIGTKVAVLGRFRIFKNRKELVVESIRKLTDYNEELLHWAEAIELFSGKYLEPFISDEKVNYEQVLKIRSCFNQQVICSCNALYSKDLGYCKCQVLTDLSDDYEFAFRDALLRCIWNFDRKNICTEQNSCSLTVISWQDLASDPGIIDTATKLVPSTQSDNESMKFDLLRRALWCLRQDRLLYLENEIEDTLQVGSIKGLLPLVRPMWPGLESDRILSKVQQTFQWISPRQVQLCINTLKGEMNL